MLIPHEVLHSLDEESMGNMVERRHKQEPCEEEGRHGSEASKVIDTVSQLPPTMHHANQCDGSSVREVCYWCQ